MENTRKTPVWDFFNSGFGIWFLSTIVIGLFTFFFNEYKDNKYKSEERELTIKKLDTEIESRISQFWVSLYPLVNQDTTYSLKSGVRADTVRQLWNAFKSPPSHNPKLTSTIYKEYETSSIASLMIELKTILEEKYDISTEAIEVDEKGDPVHERKPYTEEQKQMCEHIRFIERAAVFISSNSIFDFSDTPSVKSIWKNFDKAIILGRWERLFPYTDCLFC